MTAVPDDVPPGFARHFRNSPVTDPWEPIFSKVDAGTVSIGLRVRQAHCNGRGFLHGGLISALSDNAMGLSVVETMRLQDMERARGALTVSLSLDFLATAQIGQWMEIVPRVLKAGGSLGFVDCVVLADKQPIARGSATFRVYVKEGARSE